MICDICGKNTATVHLTEIVDGQMTELHICEVCAKEKSIEMEQQFGLSDLLAGLADFGKQLEGKEVAQAQCPVCKLTYNDFKKIGRLGCGNCYSAFSQYLLPLLKRIHGSAVHMGKAAMVTNKIEAAKEVELKPMLKVKKERESVSVDELKKRLEAAIKSENFEEAARLRDVIRALEDETKQGNESEVIKKESEKKKKKN